MGLSRKRTQQLAYFAGIMDGEGHFSIHRSKGGWYGHINVNMTDPEAVMLIWREYPEAAVRVQTNKNRISQKPFFVLTLSGYQAWRFVEDVLPFLIIKHQQGKVFKSFLAHRRRDHHGKHGARWGYGAECAGRCGRFAEKLLSIRAQAKGVNSVNALLEHGLREYRAKRAEVEQDVEILREKVSQMLERVETRDKASQPVEPMSAPEQEIVRPEMSLW